MHRLSAARQLSGRGNYLVRLAPKAPLLLAGYSDALDYPMKLDHLTRLVVNRIPPLGFS
jgi:hypothetical protein